MISVKILPSSPSGADVPLSREEEVDLILLKHDSGVESALLYAKAWSKYIKDLLAWMEKRVTMGEACSIHITPLAMLDPIPAVFGQ